MSLKKQALYGFIWTYTEQFSGQIINFLVNIILTRTLFPEDFGALGMLFVFTSIANVIVDGGMTVSVIRKKDADQRDFSTVFWINILVSLFLYCVLYLAAPFVAEFYHKPELRSILRVYSLTILIQSFAVVQSAVLLKNLNFKRQALMKIPSLVISSTVGIVMAFKGYGVWSLVFMYLIQSFLWVLFHWVFSDWKPTLVFDKSLFKSHFGYGFKLTVAEMLNSVFANLYQIVIGKFYNISQVGYYTQALTLRQVPISNVYGSAGKVLLPIFSKIQNDEQRFNETYKKVFSTLLFIIIPILTYLIVFSEPIVVLLYTEKWKATAPFLVSLAAAGMLSVVCNFNLTMLKIKGESSLILKIESFNKLQTLLFITAVVVLGFSIDVLMIVIPISAIVSYCIINYFTSKYLSIAYYETIFILLRFVGISSFSGLVSSAVNKMLQSGGLVEIASLVTSVFTGILLYGCLILFFEKSVISNLMAIVKNEK
ncbi:MULTISPECIES: lipopolysaccharide biosynthesis protein [Flavobacterium]|uniref:lipopolysaccharide biosynthesis protein n=1 Tax=Flavobacterium TaxID=237 RepID=UPI001FCCAC03|nr:MULTISPECIES: lipopolysaccharide biosynthesis protein [Flavobacterium]UOK43752.1 lipopolysaccharide biosynthesis protein [Flavobacterium enshiense]